LHAEVGLLRREDLHAVPAASTATGPACDRATASGRAEDAGATAPRPAAGSSETQTSEPETDLGFATEPGATGGAGVPAAIGRYLIIGRFPRTGQADVYRVVHPGLGKDLVLKLSLIPVRPDGRCEIIEEGKILAELDHPNLVRVYDSDFHDERPYIVMEYVRGRTLEQVASGGGLKPRQAAALLAKVAAAADYAHRKGIVHRDIKPKNILVDEGGEPRLIDFGMARLRDAWSDEPGNPGGTFAFMAPEQARVESPGEQEKVGPRSDIFALGAVLYYLLTGAVPFPGQNWRESMARARECDFDRKSLNGPKVPRDLRSICLKAMAAEPAGRYSTAEAFQQALKHYVARPKTLAAQALLLLIPAAAIWVWSIWRSPVPPPTHTVVIQTPRDAPVPLSGDVNVWIWNPNDPARQRLTLNDPGAMPLRAGDQIRVEARVNRPTHLYLVWIDGEGVPQPVYPWKPGDWNELAVEDSPVTHVSLPAREDKGWEMKKGAAGMETLLLLARESRLDLNLKPKLAGLPRPALQDARSLVWFDDWALVQNRAPSHATAKSRDRGPSFFDVDIKDPVLQTQEVLKDRLKDHFSIMRAVSFANQGG
jgi:serine/threonine protein kinase